MAATRALQLATAATRVGARGPRRLATAAQSYDAVVIGAGIIGSSITLELARRGHRTLTVERLGEAGSGSTSYSSGICRMMYSVPASVKFAWEGFTYYDRWAEHIGAEDPAGMASLRRLQGMVVRSPASEQFLSKVMAAYDDVGLEYNLWDASELERRGFDRRFFGPAKRVDDDDYGVPTGGEVSAVNFPLCGYVSSPDLAARNLQFAAERTGNATFAFKSTVSEIVRSGAAVGGVRLEGGTEVHTPVVINAAGPHSSSITSLAFPRAAENDMRLSTRPMRQEVTYAPAPPDAPWCTGGPEDMMVTDIDAGVYFRPDNNGQKVLVGGVEPPCDEPFHRFPDDPEAVYPGGPESSLTDQWTNQLYRCALRVPNLPIPSASATQGITACYDVTEDWVPIYDKSALPGYFMAIGTSGNQFKCAGVAGRLMAEIVEANLAGVDTDSQPLDFALERIPGDHSISSATFSRLRSRLATTGSVIG